MSVEAIDALAERIETNLKIASGPDMDIRFTMNRDAAQAFAQQLRLTSKLVDAHGRLRAHLKQALGQWSMYAEMIECNDGFDLATEKSPEGDMYRAAHAAAFDEGVKT
jgi:hypothetical protein